MKYKTEWNLKLLYKSENDPQIEKDIIKAEKIYEAFAKKYKKITDFTKNEHALFHALTEYETLFAMPELVKPIRYFGFVKHLNSDDRVAQARLNIYINRLTKAYNKIVFFKLNIGLIPKDKQRVFLKSKRLNHFHYFLKQVFMRAEHQLSEPEEKILNELSLPAQTLWVQGQQKLLNKQTVPHRGKHIPLSETKTLLPALPRKERLAMYANITNVLKNISHFAESELNALFTKKKITDGLRGFKKPYSATIVNYQNDEESIIKFVDIVTKHFHISHRFYKLKAKLLGLKKLEYADISARIGTLSRSFSFPESVNLFKIGLAEIDPKYTQILDRYLANGQIDVYPKKGKEGGAFCYSEVNIPTFILLNHTDTNIRSFKTLSHEMGHAFHGELSSIQTPLYQDYTTSVAEVASTFFENIGFDKLFESVSKKEKIILLHDRISDAIETVFMQVAAFNYELDLHETLRKQGALTSDEFADLYVKNFNKLLGPTFNSHRDNGYRFVAWPHLRYFFYVYSYAYGYLISNALYRKFKKDKSYIKEIEKFLSAGGSKSPEDIFKDIGIDTSKPEFFVQGLKQIEDDIQKLERLVKAA